MVVDGKVKTRTNMGSLETPARKAGRNGRVAAAGEAPKAAEPSNGNRVKKAQSMQTIKGYTYM